MEHMFCSPNPPGKSVVWAYPPTRNDQYVGVDAVKPNDGFCHQPRWRETTIEFTVRICFTWDPSPHPELIIGRLPNRLEAHY